MGQKTYTYGDEDAELVFNKFIDFMMGDDDIFLGIIDAYLQNQTHAMKLRNWIFNDSDLVAIAHDWMKETLGWPIMPSDERKFWTTRFASFFTPSDQEVHIKSLFIDKVLPLIKIGRKNG